ncbi:unnamed protein product [Peniophora sp. CBMAI 1063]|nr:unnamed protein product [Peniophora sp. CBMAI 1063]
MGPGSPDMTETNKVIYGDEYEEVNAPNASQNEGDGDDRALTPETEERKESMYVTILEDAIIGVLACERHLFTEDELECLRAYNTLDVDVKFIYARLCARQWKWIKRSDMKNWERRLGDDFATALRALAGRPELLMPKQRKTQRERTAALRSNPPKRRFTSPVKRPLRKSTQVTVIDLTSDDEAVEQLIDVQPTPSTSAFASSSTSTAVSPEPQGAATQPQAKGPDYGYFVQCRFAESPDWDWPEMLEILTVDDLKDMAKMLILQVAKKDKPTLTKAILDRVESKAGAGKGKKKQTTLLDFDDGLAHRQWVMDRFGVCIRFNEHIHELMLRVNIIYLRCTQLPDGFLTAPILERALRRSYFEVLYQRTSEIWKTRADFMTYYRLMHIAADVEWLLNPRTSKPPSGRYVDAVAYKEKALQAGHKNGAATSHAVWSIMDDEGFLEEWRNMVAFEADDERRTRGLERFEAGHILTRLVHKAADALGPLHEYTKELELLNELLAQTRWRLGRRGFWHERRTLILERHVEDRKSQTALETALEATVEALKDPHTHIIHRENLDKRLHRLEKWLKLPEDNRHKCALQRGKLPEIRISATQVQTVVDLSLDKAGRPTGTISTFYSVEKADAPSTPKGKGVAVAAPTPAPAKTGKPSARTGRTAWIGKDDKIVTVEQVALEYYQELGYKGYHCEGGIIRTLFGILFWDVIFAPIPGAFETPYQIAPLDMCDETFATTRADAIAARSRDIIDGRAAEIFERVDAEHREKQTMCTGVKWDDYEREELMEIIDCFDKEALATLCELLCEDYSRRTSGLPDLFLWHPEERHIKLSEVKSPNDRLAQHQKVWLEVLCGAGVQAEVCHVDAKVNPEVKTESKKVKVEGKNAKSEPVVKPESKGKKFKTERTQPQAEGKGKGKSTAATKGTTLKRKRTEVKPEPGSSDLDEREVDQLHDDPEGEYSPAPQRAAPSKLKSKRAAPAPSSPSEDEVSTPPPSKRPRRAAAGAPKRYKHNDEEMRL